MKKLIKTLLLAVAIMAAVPSVASAHGSSFNFKYIDGPNVIMITHNVHDPRAGAPLTYNIRLYNLTGQPIPFDQLQTEFKRDGRSVHKQSFSPSQNDDVILTYTYPKEGNYMLYTRFLNKGAQVTKGEFPLVVEKGLQHNTFGSFFSAQTLRAFLIGVIAASAYWQREQASCKASDPGSRPKRTATKRK